MDKLKIKNYFEQSAGIQDIEEISYKPEFLVLRFFYGYDDDELDAARDFADNETQAEDSEDVWYDEHYMPYLIELAVDEVSDTIEEIVDEMNLNAEYVNYELDRDDEECEFMAVFSEQGNEFDIDNILDSIGD